MISEQERFAAFRRDVNASTDPAWLRRQLSRDLVKEAVDIVYPHVKPKTHWGVKFAVLLMAAFAFNAVLFIVASI